MNGRDGDSDRQGVWAIGLMSGTSGDGIDAALIRADARSVFALGPSLTEPFEPAFRARLKSCFGDRGPIADFVGGGPVAEIAHELTERHAGSVRRLLEMAGLAPADIAIVGFHGQTIHHAPAERRTVQIGDGALLARLTGIPIVNDFRSADVAAGGEGAPLVPVFHQALAAWSGLPLPLAVLNIGGVANVTWIGREGALLAFDTGPGNALIDDWAERHIGEPMDRDGALAGRGKIDRALLAELMAHPYFRKPAPKSLDRDAFRSARLDRLSPADGAATLSAFTVESIARAVDLFPAKPTRWLVAGGGRHNPNLMLGLKARLSAPVDAVEAVGWNGDALEAQAFAYLALRSLAGLPLSFPTTTGVPAPMPGGRLHRPENHRPEKMG